MLSPAVHLHCLSQTHLFRALVHVTPLLKTFPTLSLICEGLWTARHLLLLFTASPDSPGKGAIVTFVLQNTFDFCVCVCASVHVCATCVQLLMEAEESVGSPGARVTGSQEPPDMGAGN